MTFHWPHGNPDSDIDGAWDMIVPGYDSISGVAGTALLRKLHSLGIFAGRLRAGNISQDPADR
jgi:hypothetical protein